jgi:hypothetical protein
LIAQFLKDAGYFIGPDLNAANDNLWFTLLFKWSGILSASDVEFDELLEIMIIGMNGAGEFSGRQKKIIDALITVPRTQHLPSWLRQRASSLLSARPGLKPGDGWGWKEPNSHIILDCLASRLENMKYIHVIRNGLDMAYSSNQNQLREPLINSPDLG